MKILQLTKKFPYPPKDGEIIAILALTKAFHHLGHKVHILAINTPKHYFKVHELPENIKEIAEISAVDVDTTVNWGDALKSLMGKGSYNIERFDNPEYHAALKKLLQENDFDIIQLEGTYLTPYIGTIRKYSKAPVVLRSHNVEHLIWERLAENESNPLKSFYLNILAKRIRNYELKHLNDLDAIVPISSIDEKIYRDYGYGKHIKTIETGIEPEKYMSGQSSSGNTVFFLGALDWLPNQEGLTWLLQKVWPKVRKQVPEAHLFIAGRNAPAHIRKISGRNIRFLGEVENAIQYIQEHSIMVVPLLSGSGIRIKIIEAMAAGKAIVATPIAAEGIPVRDRQHILLAEDPDIFAHKIVELYKDPTLRKYIAKEAQGLAREKFDNIQLASALIDFYKTKLL